MEFRDLKEQYAILKSEIDSAVLKVMSESRFIMGPSVSKIEKDLALYTGTRHCVSCANGTDALQIALMVWGVEKGDAVFVPDFTFFSSAEVIAAVGATPVFVDVCEDTFNIDTVDLERSIKETLSYGKLRPKAIIAVDLFGQPADYAAIRSLADQYSLLVLEDGAQGFGGAIGKKKACSFGDIATTSFFPAKPLGCYGDGGAIFTDNDKWAELADSYRIHGKGKIKYENLRIGMNSRLDTIQAAVLEVKLKAFREYELTEVNKAAERYNKLLKDIPFVKLPLVKECFTSSWAQYTIKLKDGLMRDKLQQTLKDEGIPSMVYYPSPMSGQSAFASFEKRECPVAKDLCSRVLSIPVHPYIKEEEQALIADIIRKTVRE